MLARSACIKSMTLPLVGGHRRLGERDLLALDFLLNGCLDASFEFIGIFVRDRSA